MFRKTFSQKAARVFEVVGYLLLVPAILSLIFPFMMAIASLASLQIHLFVMILIPFFIFGLGIILLGGYIKHPRGILDEEKIIPLWGGTLVYNVLPLLPVFYQIFTFIAFRVILYISHFVVDSRGFAFNRRDFQ
jgi:hypothetical protein